MRNAYKRLHIFKCVHEAHRGFESRMSAHHILNRKGCFPRGCFHFRSHCKLFKQGKPCYRGYKRMKRSCNGCRYFYEEKIHNHPELMVSEAEYQDFRRELDLFEDWLMAHREREHDIHGRIDGVKPLFHKRVFDKGESFAFSGFLLIFTELFIGMDHMEDHVYVRLSPKTYNGLKFGAGDVISARATLHVDDGRLVLRRLKRIDIEERGEAPLWNQSKALVTRETATQMPTQPDGCVQCPFGALVDVDDHRYSELRNYRQLYCLRGVPDHRVCDLYSHYAGEDEAGSEKKKPANAAACVTRRVNVNP